MPRPSPPRGQGDLRVRPPPPRPIHPSTHRPALGLVAAVALAVAAASFPVWAARQRRFDSPTSGSPTRWGEVQPRALVAPGLPPALPAPLNARAARLAPTARAQLGLLEGIPYRRDGVLTEAADWAELTATYRGLPAAALTQPGAAGPTWSVKDVLNHLAAWQEAALRIIPEYLAGRRATLGRSTDRFNAEQQAADQTRSLAGTRRRLNASRRALLALIAEVPDAALLDPAGRINWWVRYTMYSHYGEHISNLSAFALRHRK